MRLASRTQCRRNFFRAKTVDESSPTDSTGSRRGANENVRRTPREWRNEKKNCEQTARRLRPPNSREPGGGRARARARAHGSQSLIYSSVAQRASLLAADDGEECSSVRPSVRPSRWETAVAPRLKRHRSAAERHGRGNLGRRPVSPSTRLAFRAPVTGRISDLWVIGVRFVRARTRRDAHPIVVVARGRVRVVSARDERPRAPVSPDGHVRRPDERFRTGDGARR